MNTLGGRIKFARERKGMSRGELAKKAGITYSTLADIESGAAMRSRYIAEIASALGVSSLWLATGTGNIDGVDVAQENDDDYIKVKTVKLKLSAGITGFAVDCEAEDGAPIMFRKEYAAKRGWQPGALIALKVRGDSMEPTLYDGDLVVVNTKSVEPKDGAVFALNYEWELVIKRVVRDAGSWWMYSDNSSKHHPRKIFTENTFIIGEVVYRQSEHI